MGPHRRMPRIAMWGAAALAAVLAFAWVWSAFRYVGVYTPWGGSLTISSGLLHLSDTDSWPVPPQGTTVVRGENVWGLRWWFDWYAQPGLWQIAVPLWFMSSLASIASALSWRVDVRARRMALADACTACGYSRAGLALNAPCPECGASPASVAPSTP